MIKAVGILKTCSNWWVKHLKYIISKIPALKVRLYEMP